MGREIRRVYKTDFCNSLQQVLLRAVFVCFKKYIISNIISIVIAIVIVIAAVIAIFVA